jgi:hypothetical protein
MPDNDVAAAYRTINEADPETKKQVARLRRLHKQAGEDKDVSDRAIAEIMEGGAGAADRLRGTADAVARLHGIQEEE